MIVVCEGCQRRFQLDDARIPESGARVRCKHCHHRFRVPPPGDAANEASAPSAPSASGPNNADTLFGTSVSPEDSAAGEETSDSFGELRFVNEPAIDGDEEEEEEAAAEAPPPEIPEEPAASFVVEEEAAEPVAEPPAESASYRGANAPWEFGDSSLSFDPAAATSEDGPPATDLFGTTPEEAPELRQETGEEQGPPGVGPDAGEDSGAAPTVDETPSLRAVGPDSDSHSPLFEVAEDADGGNPLRLADEPESEVSADEPPEPATEPSSEMAPEAEEASAPAEIGSAADWDVLAAESAPEAAPAPAPTPEAVATAQDDEPSGWTAASDDLPEMPVPSPPSPGRGRAWLEHAGWTLSLVLLLAVARGSVRIDPLHAEVPPGQVEVVGLSAENVRARFVENARSGTLFVVSGELRNRGTGPRLASRLRIVLLDADGRQVAINAAPVASALPEAMVRETPLGALAQQQMLLAEALAERSLAPGEAVSFRAILAEVPEQAVRFRIEADEGARRAPPPEEKAG